MPGQGAGRAYRSLRPAWIARAFRFAASGIFRLVEPHPSLVDKLLTSPPYPVAGKSLF